MIGGSSRRADSSTRGDRGQATVEFALVVPLIALLVLGVAQIARLTALQVTVVDAARAGARAAAVDPSPGSARRAILAVGPGRNTRIRSWREQGDPDVARVQVTMVVEAVPMIGWTSVHLHATSTMAVEATS